MSKIKNIKNFDNFKDQFKDYDGYFFNLDNYREKFTAHVCNCGHFASAPKKCECKVLEVDSQAHSYDISGLENSNLRFLPETIKGLKLSDVSYLITVDAFVFNYDSTTETLDTSIVPHSFIFDREKWELLDVKSLSPTDAYLSVAKSFRLLEIIAKAIPSEYEELNTLAKGLSFLTTDVFSASKETIATLRGYAFINLDHELADNLMNIFYQNRYRNPKEIGSLYKIVNTAETLLEEPLEVLATKYGKELLYVATYITSKSLYPDLALGVNNSQNLFDYASYTPSRINLSNILMALKPNVEEFWVNVYNKFPSELYQTATMFPYWDQLMPEEINFIENFFNDVSDSTNKDQYYRYYRNSVNSLGYILQTYSEYKEKIYDESDSYEEKVNKINNLAIFYKQTIGVLKTNLGNIMRQFELFTNEKMSAASSNPNYGVRDYMQLVLKNDLDTKIKAAGKVDFFIELLDQDALYALKLLNTKGRLTKDMKIEAIKKLAK